MVQLAAMKILISICVIFIVVIDKAVCGIVNDRNTREVETYSTKYDNIDVDAILASSRLLRNYMRCLLDQGPCTPEGELLKKYLPDALQTECTKCSPKQKQIAGKVLSFILQYHKDYWKQLLDKYDKDGSYIKKHEQLKPGEAEDYSDLDEAK